MRTFKSRAETATEAPELQVRATGLDIDEGCMHVHLADGGVVSVPYTVTPRLQGATQEQRRNWRFIGPGMGIHWPDIDEDLSVAGLVRDFGGGIGNASVGS
jgi:hypothetical protein